VGRQRDHRNRRQQKQDFVSKGDTLAFHASRIERPRPRGQSCSAARRSIPPPELDHRPSDVSRLKPMSQLGKGMKSFTKTDRIIFVLAVLTLAAFSYFMYDDSLLFPRHNDSGLQKIGQVSVSNNDVRLKTASAFTWFPAQKSDVVHLQ